MNELFEAHIFIMLATGVGKGVIGLITRFRSIR